MVTQAPDVKPGHYYVSVRDGPQYGLLLGPYPDHQSALDKVETVRRKVCKLEARAHWYSFGTCRLPVEPLDGITIPSRVPEGKLNHLFPWFPD